MRLLLVRLRGIALMALVWGGAWAVVGMLAALLTSRLARFGVAPILSTGLVFGFIYGTVVGGLFAVALMLAERRKSVEQLSFRRFAIWGTLAGPFLLAATTLVPFLLGAQAGLPGDFVPAVVILGILGGVSAVTTLKLARGPGERLPPAGASRDLLSEEH